MTITITSAEFETVTVHSIEDIPAHAEYADGSFDAEATVEFEAGGEGGFLPSGETVTLRLRADNDGWCDMGGTLIARSLADILDGGCGFELKDLPSDVALHSPDDGAAIIARIPVGALGYEAWQELAGEGLYGLYEEHGRTWAIRHDGSEFEVHID